MPTYKTKGIVINKQDFQEADRCLSVYGYGCGKTKVICRGARRVLSKLGGHLELFSEVDLVLARGKTFDTVTGVKIIKSFKQIRKSLWKTSIAVAMVEMVEKMTEEDFQEIRIYELLREHLNLLEEVELYEQGRLLFISFGIRFLNMLGYGIEMKKCVECGNELKPVDNKFSLAGGGFVCSTCSNNLKQLYDLSKDTFLLLRFIAREPVWRIVKVREVKEKNFREIEILLHDFVRYVLSRDLKTKRFWEQIRFGGYFSELVLKTK